MPLYCVIFSGHTLVFTLCLTCMFLALASHFFIYCNLYWMLINVGSVQIINKQIISEMSLVTLRLSDWNRKMWRTRSIVIVISYVCSVFSINNNNTNTNINNIASLASELYPTMSSVGLKVSCLFSQFCVIRTIILVIKLILKLILKFI